MPEDAAARPRSRHASILDVAALAGVSAATVSRSLRGRGSVSPTTRQRVLDAARELSYSASPHASGLASAAPATALAKYHRPMNGATMPTVVVRPDARPEACGDAL